MKLNFNEVKRPSLDIVLNDENKTELTLVTPAKYEVDKFLQVFNKVVSMKADDITNDDIYALASTILSSNTKKIAVTAEECERIFTLYDVILLLKTYNEFILGLYNSKN